MNKVFFKNSQKMDDIKDESIDLVITSPPYFNIKDYSKDGKQDLKHSEIESKDVGAINQFDDYIKNLLKVWKECYRVLKPNGKLCINVPLMPILKKEMNISHNRYIFDLQSRIQNSILNSTKFHLLDLYIWNRVNSTKKLMFGSYPFPANFYAQNTTEFITIYVKDGKPKKNKNNVIKELSKLSKEEWVTYTKQIWDLPIPNKSDLAFGKHSAIMPEEIVKRLVKMFSLVGDTVLDPFAGSGTTLKVAYENGRKFLGYEIYKHYQIVIDEKIKEASTKIPQNLKEFV